MDYGATGQGGLNLFDPDLAVDINSLQALPTLPRINVDWDGGFPELSNQQPAGLPVGVYPTPAAMAFPHVADGIGYRTLCVPDAGTCDVLAGTSSSSSNNNGCGKADGMLAIAHNSTRAARNGREQQRAQKISDVIDKLKGMLDKAKFTTGDNSSKLHVLVSCESYIRNLQNKTRCHEMEAKLRSAAQGNQYSADAASSSGGKSNGSRRAGARSSNDIEWTKKLDRARQSAESQGGETDAADTVDSCTSGSGADRGDGSSSSSGGDGDSSSDGDGKKKVDAFFDEESSSTGTSSAAGKSRAFGEGGSAAARVARRTAESAGSASSSVEEDGEGDTGSSGDSSGGDTLASTTTDSASRGFTTDSSFSGDSGSADSGDAASGDTGSDGSEEGEAAGARMRVVNYFDIFRLSNVPMAIADKEGALVDVNDAMRGFGRIDQDTVKTLTVKSLVAPESSMALENAMNDMLLVSSVPQEAPGPAHGGSQPFLANAGIGDRPTVLTVSLVYDERGEASAFHVALIPMAQKAEGKSSASCERSSTEYNGEAPGLCVDEALRGNRGDKGARCASSVTGKRSVRVWDSRERTTSQKRPAIRQQQSSAS